MNLTKNWVLPHALWKHKQFLLPSGTCRVTNPVIWFQLGQWCEKKIEMLKADVDNKDANHKKNAIPHMDLWSRWAKK